MSKGLPSEGGPIGRSTVALSPRPIQTAAIVRQGKPKLYYQTHRAVDANSEVITAAEVTPGDVNEAHLLIPLLEAHREHTGRSAHVVVADSKYGTIENFLAYQDRRIWAHLPDLGGWPKSA